VENKIIQSVHNQVHFDAKMTQDVNGRSYFITKLNKISRIIRNRICSIPAEIFIVHWAQCKNED